MLRDGDGGVGGSDEEEAAAPSSLQDMPCQSFHPREKQRRSRDASAGELTGTAAPLAAPTGRPPGPRTAAAHPKQRASE